MKKYPYIPALLLLLAATPCMAQKVYTTADYDRAASRMAVNMNKLIDRGAVRPVWLPDGNFWYNVNTPAGAAYVLVNVKDGKRRTAAKKDDLLPAEKSLPQLVTRANEVASPDGLKAAFIKNWNLWVRDQLTGAEKQLTTDGEKDFGYATDNAGWKHSDRPVLLWSPDSKKIATFKQDQRHVKDMYLVKTKVGAPELSQWKYPLPGDSAIIKIHRVIVDVERGVVTKLKTAADDHRSTLCDDIACGGSFDDNEWSADGKVLAFVSTPRDHKKATLRLADAETGDVRNVLEETVATQYESGWSTVNWRLLAASNELIWFSERDGWGHLYLYDLATGKVKNQITSGNYVVTEVLKVDGQKRQIYFEAKGREAGRHPYHNYYYRVDFSGKNLLLLTPEDGNHSISFSNDGKYFVDNYSKQDVPNTALLKDVNGKVITRLEQADVSRLTATGWKPPVPFSVKSANGQFDLYGIMYRPSDFDPSAKYPVVVYIYPGPQGGSVSSWGFTAIGAADNQALAELGFVVVELEGSCNPGRSKAFHDACYGNMGENTLPDQVAGLKQLNQQHPYMDMARVGIWGHSGGGYAAADAMFSYPDFFKVGISESGNHDNRSYEDDWGERYIGLLKKEAGGRDNYEAQANQINVKNLKGKLMIAHGNMDDNVPPYNSYLLVDALVKANKDFDLVIFPHARHGYGSDGFYMMRRRWDYFVRYLAGGTPPQEYKISITPGGR